MGQPALLVWFCMWGRGLRGNTAAFLVFSWLSAGFQSLPLLPTRKLGPFGTDSYMGGFVYILGPCGSLQWTFLWGWEFLPPLRFPQVFIARGFEALFPHAGPLGCVVYLTPQLFLLIYLHADVGSPSVPAASPSRFSSSCLAKHPLCPGCLSLPLLPVWMNVSSLIPCPTPWLFNFLVVGLPYSSIFCQFWLVFVFKFVFVLLLVVRGDKVHLPMPPSQPEVLFLVFAWIKWSKLFMKLICFHFVPPLGIGFHSSMPALKGTYFYLH